jgi:hypothetical protein
MIVLAKRPFIVTRAITKEQDERRGHNSNVLMALHQRTIILGAFLEEVV